MFETINNFSCLYFSWRPSEATTIHLRGEPKSGTTYAHVIKWPSFLSLIAHDPSICLLYIFLGLLSFSCAVSWWMHVRLWGEKCWCRTEWSNVQLFSFLARMPRGEKSLFPPLLCTWCWTRRLCQCILFLETFLCVFCILSLVTFLCVFCYDTLISDLSLIFPWSQFHRWSVSGSYQLLLILIHLASVLFCSSCAASFGEGRVCTLSCLSWKHMCDHCNACYNV